MIKIDRELNVDTSIKDPQHRVTVIVSIVDDNGTRVESATATCGVGEKGADRTPVQWTALESAEKRAREAAMVDLKRRLMQIAKNAETAVKALAELEMDA